MENRKFISRCVLGSLFIAAGIGYIGNFIGLWHGFTIFFDGFWTLFLIIPAVLSFIESGFGMVNSCLFIIGVALLLNDLDIINSRILTGIIIGSIFIAVGLGIILKPVIDKRRHENFRNRYSDAGGQHSRYSSQTSGGTDNGGNSGNSCNSCNSCNSGNCGASNTSSGENNRYSVTFSDQRFCFDGKPFSSCEISVSFGAATLDLRKAVIESDCTVMLSTSFGDITVLLPENVSAEVTKYASFGSVKELHANPAIPGITARIRASVSFGEIRIK